LKSIDILNGITAIRIECHIELPLTYRQIDSYAD
jgi:hypothetical protein